MKETLVALEAVGTGLTDWVGRARREHTTFVVVEGETPVARLAPVERRCTGRELAKVVARACLSADESSRWSEDLRAARAALTAPEDKWR